MTLRRKRVRRQREHRDVRRLGIHFEQPGRFDAIHVRQPWIHEHQVGLRDASKLKARLAAADFMEVEAVGAEHRAVDDAIVLVVVDDENRSCCCLSRHMQNF